MGIRNKKIKKASISLSLGKVLVLKNDNVLFPLAQFETVDCSLGKENTSTSGRQQQQTLRQRNWTNKALVSTSSSASSSLSFPSSPILKLSPLTSSPLSYPTLKLSQSSPSSSPTKLSPSSPSSPNTPLDGEMAKVDSSLPLEKQW